MLRVGVDLMDVARVAKTMERYGERFYTRFFTSAERAACEGQPHRLAARIAVKEAVAKALGTGIGDVKWTEIEVECDERGRPHLRLHGNASALAAELGLATWDISLSHTHEQAVAFVVALAGVQQTNN
jgi:holo-[acyl-carrier protein] synthase